MFTLTAGGAVATIPKFNLVVKPNCLTLPLHNAEKFSCWKLSRHPATSSIQFDIQLCANNPRTSKTLHFCQTLSLLALLSFQPQTFFVFSLPYFVCVSLCSACLALYLHHGIHDRLQSTSPKNVIWQRQNNAAELQPVQMKLVSARSPVCCWLDGWLTMGRVQKM